MFTRSNLLVAALAACVIVITPNLCQAQQQMAKAITIMEKLSDRLDGTNNRLDTIEKQMADFNQRLAALEGRNNSPGYSAPVYKPYTPPAPPAYSGMPAYANYSQPTPFNQFQQGMGQGFGGCQYIGTTMINGRLTQVYWCPGQ